MVYYGSYSQQLYQGPLPPAPQTGSSVRVLGPALVLLQTGSGLAPVRLRSGSGLAPVRLGSGSGLAPLRSGSGPARVRLRSGSGLAPLRSGSGPAPVRLRSSSGLAPLRSGSGPAPVRVAGVGNGCFKDCLFIDFLMHVRGLHIKDLVTDPSASAEVPQAAPYGALEYSGVCACV